MLRRLHLPIYVLTLCYPVVRADHLSMRHGKELSQGCKVSVRFVAGVRPAERRHGGLPSQARPHQGGNAARWQRQRARQQRRIRRCPAPGCRPEQAPPAGRQPRRALLAWLQAAAAAADQPKQAPRSQGAPAPHGLPLESLLRAPLFYHVVVRSLPNGCSNPTRRQHTGGQAVHGQTCVQRVGSA